MIPAARKGWAILGAISALLACSAGPDGQDSQTAAVDDAVRKYPEVGLVHFDGMPAGAYCTGTLATLLKDHNGTAVYYQNLVITNGHCENFTIDTSTSGEVTFQPPDGSDPVTIPFHESRAVTTPADNYDSAEVDTFDASRIPDRCITQGCLLPGSLDVALIHLDETVPANIAPPAPLLLVPIDDGDGTLVQFHNGTKQTVPHRVYRYRGSDELPGTNVLDIADLRFTNPPPVPPGDPNYGQPVSGWPAPNPPVGQFTDYRTLVRGQDGSPVFSADGHLVAIGAMHADPTRLMNGDVGTHPPALEVPASAQQQVNDFFAVFVQNSRIDDNLISLMESWGQGDSCGTHTDCYLCDLDAKCGWCASPGARNGGTCVNGTSTGPSGGVTCGANRYAWVAGACYCAASPSGTSETWTANSAHTTLSRCVGGSTVGGIYQEVECDVQSSSGGTETCPSCPLTGGGSQPNWQCSSTGRARCNSGFLQTEQCQYGCTPGTSPTDDAQCVAPCTPGTKC